MIFLYADERKQKYDLETIQSNVLFYDTKENNEANIFVKNNIVTYDGVELFDITKLNNMNTQCRKCNQCQISYTKQK